MFIGGESDVDGDDAGCVDVFDRVGGEFDADGEFDVDE